MATALTTTPNGQSHIYKVLWPNSATGVLVVTGKTQVYGWSISNVNAAVRFVKLYDLAVAPTTGTTVPVLTLAIPGAATGGVNSFATPVGIPFSTGLGIAATTLVADNDATAPAASEIVVNLFYH